MLEHFFITAIYFFLGFIITSISYTKNRIFNTFISILFALALMFLTVYFGKRYGNLNEDQQLYLFLIWVLVSFYSYFFGSKPTNGSKHGSHGGEGKPTFVLQTQKGAKITFGDPFDNFMILAGANGGKTKALGKNLLSEYIRTQFAGFIYDYKDFDYTKTAYFLCKKHGFNHPFYYISFTDLERTYRFNPIKPSVIKSDDLLIQLMDDILSATLEEGDSKNIWYGAALGVLQGVAVRFSMDFKEQCTVPHILLFILFSDRERLMNFLKERPESRLLAKGFFDSEDSEKTQASILFSLSTYIGKMGFNKKIMYVLSGDDFDFNLIDPKEPKLVSVCNSYQIESLLAPVLSLLLTVSTRQFTMANRVNCFYLLDEATTIKISNFEKLPSVLREYRCSFTFITQSGAKIERTYGKFDKSSIMANFSNLFLGRTKDTEALKSYGLLFTKKEEVRRTDTRGRNSDSVSLSKVEKDRYDPSFFTGLTAGEFAGSAAHSNFGEFHEHFKFYVPDPSESNDLPIVKMVTENDIERNYREIIQFVSNL